jgi:rhamnogalacturonyl hydrolase YesR
VGCLKYQRPDGLFHNISNPDSFVETNLSQMVAYSIDTGIHGGWLPDSYPRHVGPQAPGRQVSESRAFRRRTRLFPF